MRSIILAVFMLLCVGLLGCGISGRGKTEADKAAVKRSANAASPQDLILGHWTWTGSFQGKVISITNEFREDGVVKVVQDGIPIDVNYRIVGDDQIDYGIHGRSKIVAITKDKLDIIGNDGVRRTWTRP